MMSQTAQVIQFRRPRMEHNEEAPLNSGFIKLYRTLQESAFAGRPEYLSSWVHILMLASHKPRKTMLGTKPVQLEIGQFASGRKALAERVGVTEKQMRSIISFFEAEGMLTKQSTRNGSIFTVCNYSDYQEKKGQHRANIEGQQEGQPKPSNDGACIETEANERANGGPTKRATTQEHNNTIPNGIDTYASSADSQTVNAPTPKRSIHEYPKEFEWIWQQRPRREGSDPKRKAFQACNARIKQGATWRELAEGMKRYAAYCEAKSILNTEFVKTMASFFGPDEHYTNDWKVNHGQAPLAQRSTATGPKLSTVDRQHAAASNYLARLHGQRPSEDINDSVVASYE
ncbi:hypothetical protein [Neptunomonas sp. XY-337]|uniref:hypothetical protein n=1 Tax=Neptunomonas sp. XY-337 TaxID=2561897 RepID=UPI0010AB0B99|nr:hypothetical protein [Neptunomonas sp. XY-337]